MADITIMQTLYGSEWVQAYEQKQSVLRGTVTVEGEVKGDTFLFILEGAADEAVERGANGNIPYAQDNQSSSSTTLKDYHHLVRKTGFSIAGSSVNQRLSMQRRGVVAANKKTDALILAQMATSTVSVAAAGNTLAHMMGATSLLDAAYVPNDGERYGLLTPRAWARAMAVNQFASGDWVSDKPFMKQTKWRDWNGVKWAMYAGLTGVGTNSATCLVYHKAAVGHALNQGEMRSAIGENNEHDYSWARTSTSQGAKLLMTAGVVKLLHDDTAALL